MVNAPLEESLFFLWARSHVLRTAPIYRRCAVKLMSPPFHLVKLCGRGWGPEEERSTAHAMLAGQGCVARLPSPGNVRADVRAVPPSLGGHLRRLARAH